MTTHKGDSLGTALGGTVGNHVSVGASGERTGNPGVGAAVKQWKSKRGVGSQRRASSDTTHVGSGRLASPTDETAVVETLNDEGQLNDDGSFDSDDEDDEDGDGGGLDFL